MCVDVFMWRRPQTVKSQAVLEQRKRGGLKTKLSSEQISCKQQKTGGLKKKKSDKNFLIQSLTRPRNQ